VIVPCGHSLIGKAEEKYQRASILLAKNGIASLCYDPPGQGERHQWVDAAGRPKVLATTTSASAAFRWEYRWRNTLFGTACELWTIWRRDPTLTLRAWAARATQAAAFKPATSWL
jgi:hypothetical protein